MGQRSPLSLDTELGCIELTQAEMVIPDRLDIGANCPFCPFSIDAEIRIASLAGFVDKIIPQETVVLL